MGSEGELGDAGEVLEEEEREWSVGFWVWAGLRVVEVGGGVKRVVGIGRTQILSRRRLCWERREWCQSRREMRNEK